MARGRRRPRLGGGRGRSGGRGRRERWPDIHCSVFEPSPHHCTACTRNAQRHGRQRGGEAVGKPPNGSTICTRCITCIFIRGNIFASWMVCNPSPPERQGREDPPPSWHFARKTQIGACGGVPMCEVSGTSPTTEGRGCFPVSKLVKQIFLAPNTLDG